MHLELKLKDPLEENPSQSFDERQSLKGDHVRCTFRSLNKFPNPKNLEKFSFIWKLVAHLLTSGDSPPILIALCFNPL